MTGFEMWISGAGSDRSTNCLTIAFVRRASYDIIVQILLILYKHWQGVGTITPKTFDL